MLTGATAEHHHTTEPLQRRVRFLGHASLLIDLDDTRIVTDPLLRQRVAMLYWRHPIPRAALTHPVDAVVISHMHQDHLDLPSLRGLGYDVPLLVPRRAGPFLERRGFRDVTELRPGDAVTVGKVRVRAVPARHTGFRPPFGPWGDCIGFVIDGSASQTSVYFAGDTDIFADMDALGPIDVALLPVAGWGPTLGPGHMDARGAAEALQLIRPRVAIPMHWGTFAPFGLHWHQWSYLIRPPLDFQRHARALMPDVDVTILEPGEALDLDPLITRWAAQERERLGAPLHHPTAPGDGAS
ncbi:MAG: MBL fold metallo-hydrolase [Chloroflexi bacterium]|nr:MBL fold metallo-hydrolase [Chloroflexota bacterium]